MKNKSIVSLFIGLLGLGITTTSCEDMLTPDLDRYVENFNGTDTVNFYLGILGNVQDMIENNVLLGDLRGDLADTTMYVSDTVADISNFVQVDDGENGLLNRAAYYKVINQCNFYLARVDTMALKNNNYYMRREFAQVEMVRAWTYMQLVQNYGRVPFITQPVDNANTGWETNPEAWATPDNLLDLLGDELMQAYNYEKLYGLPDYGSMNNGSMSIPQRRMTFPGDLVLGDLYLLRGASLSDYERAATYYYTYINDLCEDRGSGISENMRSLSRSGMSGGQETYSTSASSWAGSFIGQTSDNENITIIPSAANSSFGQVLTRIQQTYGFDPSSTSSTTGSTDDEGNETATTTGQISVTANYRNRQIGPSQKYLNLSNAQLQQDPQYGDQGQITGVEYLENVGDGRLSGSVNEVNTDLGRLYFVSKFATPSMRSTNYAVSENSFSFSYVIPVYRLRQVMLRFAEAINRAGYPRHAFAILRNGLNYEEMPEVRNDSIVWNEETQTGKVVPYTVPVADGCNYIDVDELRRAERHPEFLDFSQTYWVNMGIHEGGCGTTSDYDTLYDYEPLVAQRMLDEAQRSGNLQTVQAYAKKLLAEGEEGETGEGGEGESDDPHEGWPIEDADEPKIPEDIGLQINAVETLIADEMALETAFEGFRYFDLLRMARHKNNDNWGELPANYGTQWFAWMIARRSENLKPYEQPNIYNSALYNKLLNIDNWYLKNPEY